MSSAASAAKDAISENAGSGFASGRLSRCGILYGNNCERLRRVEGGKSIVAESPMYARSKSSPLIDIEVVLSTAG